MEDRAGRFRIVLGFGPYFTMFGILGADSLERFLRDLFAEKLPITTKDLVLTFGVESLEDLKSKTSKTIADARKRSKPGERSLKVWTVVTPTDLPYWSEAAAVYSTLSQTFPKMELLSFLAENEKRIVSHFKAGTGVDYVVNIVLDELQGGKAKNN